MALTEREQTERTVFTGVITCALGLVFIIAVVFSSALVPMADLFNSFLEFIAIPLAWLTLARAQAGIL